MSALITGIDALSASSITVACEKVRAAIPSTGVDGSVSVMAMLLFYSAPCPEPAGQKVITNRLVKILT